ncbi:hypothetical protein RCH09_003784 [Actimicrobium sp. GrIS 1.19]|uniref:PEP-CTERM sorting domain-containing protein n=1 Tax=Actimicrobium sp. GrIS 1.19 TaxID=3071708 RepID=UPI002E06B825|nr:hypothetical protein [Actimicrobium sp. GrIS 1.19]
MASSATRALRFPFFLLQIRIEWVFFLKIFKQSEQMKISLFAFLLLVSLRAFSSDYSEAITLHNSWGVGYPANYGLSIRLDDDPSHSSEIELNYVPGLSFRKAATIQVAGGTLDPAAQAFLAPYGEEFSLATMRNNNFQNIGGAIFGSQINTGTIISADRRYLTSGTFYLAIASTPSFYSGYYQTTPSVFGWAEFSYSPSGLQLLASDLTYDGAGIFIGTNEVIPAVPEPETYAMMIAGLSLLGLIAWRKKSG